MARPQAALDVRLCPRRPHWRSTWRGRRPRSTPRTSRRPRVETASVDDYFNGALGAEPTELEAATAEAVGHLSLLIGGPPCQGHSNLNNHTRRDDPKNALYARMARAAEVLRPQFVLVENVPSVRHDIWDVVGATRAHLERAGYSVADATVSLHPLGVAQRRKRHVMLAASARSGRPGGDADGRRQSPGRAGARPAVGHRRPRRGPPVGFDTPPRASADNVRRMQYLLDHGVVRPTQRRAPAVPPGDAQLQVDVRAAAVGPSGADDDQRVRQHRPGALHAPELARALTAHEAARIQGFPDYFTFESVLRRADLATMIGNAVPPVLAREIVAELLRGVAETAADV